MTPSVSFSRPVRRVVLSLVVLLWIAAFAASHVPAKTWGRMPISDKRAHFAGFFMLCGLLLLCLTTHGMSRRRRISIALAAMAVYAVFDEVTQPLVRRHFDVLDIVADIAGALTATILYELIFALSRRRGRAGR